MESQEAFMRRVLNQIEREEDSLQTNDNFAAVEVIGPITYAQWLKQNKITLVKSIKGHDKAVHQGFLYTKHLLSKPDGTIQYWKCEKNSVKDGGCLARLHTLVEGNIFLKLLNEHNHEV